jgi:hypothetical protein
MNSNNEINLEELNTATNILFDHLRESGITKIELKREYYWEIAVEQLYNIEANPTDVSIGNLFYDRDDMRNIVTGRSQPLVTLFQKLAPLLIYVAHEVAEIQPLSKPDREET